MTKYYYVARGGRLDGTDVATVNTAYAGLTPDDQGLIGVVSKSLVNVYTHATVDAWRELPRYTSIETIEPDYVVMNVEAAMMALALSQGETR